jgi:hypothetical protein
MKPLETTTLVEVTLVLAIENYGSGENLCGMEYITTAAEAQVIGWSERTLKVVPAEKGNK